MAVYAVIPNAEVDIDQPVKSSTAKKFRDNPLAVTQGDPTALAAGEGVAIDYDFGAGPQTSIITDEIDTDKVLAPDGLGQAQWLGGGIGTKLVERKEFAAPTTSATFAGLNGDLHGIYVLYGRIRGAGGGAPLFTLRPNGLTSNQQTLRSINGGAAANAASILVGDPGAGNQTTMFNTIIHAKETVLGQAVPRTFIGQSSVVQQIGVGISRIIEQASVWNGAGNITTLDVVSSVANGIGAGSELVLYRLIQG